MQNLSDPGAAPGGRSRGPHPQRPAERPMKFVQIRVFCWRGEGGKG